MKKYVSPSLETTAITNADILAGSDVLIDIENLFGEQN